MRYEDPIVEEIWQVRERLLEQYGGIDGFEEFIKKKEKKHTELLIKPEKVKNKNQEVD